MNSVNSADPHNVQSKEKVEIGGDNSNADDTSGAFPAEISSEDQSPDSSDTVKTVKSSKSNSDLTNSQTANTALNRRDSKRTKPTAVFNTIFQNVKQAAGIQRTNSLSSEKENLFELEDETEEDHSEYEINTQRDDKNDADYCNKLLNELVRFQGIIDNDRKRILDLKKQKNQLIKRVQEKNKEQDAMASRFEHERRGMQRIRDQKDLEARDLEKEIRRLKEESSRYQVALGNATNVRWGDDDTNNSVQLVKSIQDLQEMLANFTSLKGKKWGIKIHEVEGSNLLTTYKCRTTITSKNGKNILSAALQRYILETLFTEIEKFLSYKPPHPNSHPRPPPTNKEPTASGTPKQSQTNKEPITNATSKMDVESGTAALTANSTQQHTNTSTQYTIVKVTDTLDYLEVDIIGRMNRLCSLIDNFRENRLGTDDLTRITPIKIRQQVYAILGIRGFMKKQKEAKESKKQETPTSPVLTPTPSPSSNTHFFIGQMVKTCIKIMTQHRDIKYDETMAQQHREDATAMVQEVIHLYLRLNAQEPIPEFRKFFEAGEPVRLNVMNGPELNDEDGQELEVEICSFPLIVSEKNKVLYKAQVETRSSQPTGWFRKG